MAQMSKAWPVVINPASVLSLSLNSNTVSGQTVSLDLL